MIKLVLSVKVAHSDNVCGTCVSVCPRREELSLPSKIVVLSSEKGPEGQCSPDASTAQFRGPAFFSGCD